MVMNMYSDIDDKWSFNETGDLKINYNYRQSIKHRLLCPLHYLNIYYENYGSNLYQQLGERYNEEIIFEEVSNALRQDVNIYNYEINQISFIDGELVLSLTINGDDIWFSYHIYDEINEFINVDCDVYYEEDWKLKITVNINSNEYTYIKNLNEMFGDIETISYVNCEHKNEIIEINLIINGFKETIKCNLNGEITNLKKKTLKIEYYYVEEKPLSIYTTFTIDDGKEYDVVFKSDDEEKSVYIENEKDGHWNIIDSDGLNIKDIIEEDDVTIITLGSENE